MSNCGLLNLSEAVWAISGGFRLMLQHWQAPLLEYSGGALRFIFLVAAAGLVCQDQALQSIQSISVPWNFVCNLLATATINTIWKVSKHFNTFFGSHLLFTSFSDLPCRVGPCLGTLVDLKITFSFHLQESSLFSLLVWVFRNWIHKSRLSLSFVSLCYLFSTVKMEPISHSFPLSLSSCNRLISLSLSRSLLSFMSLNKAGNGPWKWCQHSHAYRQALSLLCAALCKWKYTFTRMRGSLSFTHLI